MKMIKIFSFIFIFFVSIGYIYALPLIPKDKSVIYWDAKDDLSILNGQLLSSLPVSYNVIIVKSASIESSAVDIRGAYKLECSDDINNEIGTIRTQDRIVLLSIEEGNPESLDQLNPLNPQEFPMFTTTLHNILDVYSFSGISFDVKNDSNLIKMQSKISNIKELATQLKAEDPNIIVVVTLRLDTKAFTDEEILSILNTLKKDKVIDWLQVQTDRNHQIYVYDRQSTETISAFEKRLLPVSSAVQPTEL